MNEFKNYHPAVNFIYFVSVITYSMVIMHPVCLAVSLVCAFLYSIVLNGKKAAKFNFLFIIPLILVSALLNPLFNHEGITILGYFKSGNPLTLESVIYGFASAFMLGSVIAWFSCYNAVMSSDKFIYLFGKIIPSLSLVFSMVLRLVPRFKEQMREITQSRKCIGKNVSDGKITERIKNCINVMSAMITLTMENSIETADSMKSRGYGLPKRTAFSNYVFDKRDKITLFAVIGFDLYVLSGIIMKKISFSYFPAFGKINLSLYSISLFTAYFLLCITPVIIELREVKRWKAIK